MLACGIGIYDRGPVGEQSTLQAAGGGWAGAPGSSTLVPGVCVPVAEDICVLHPFPVLENTFLFKKRASHKIPPKDGKKGEKCVDTFLCFGSLSSVLLTFLFTDIN